MSDLTNYSAGIFLHHHNYMKSMMLEWPDFPENLHENYCHETVKQIKKDPLKWLCSLPMVEYAHILTVFTAHHLGGDPEQYVKILHHRMLAPVLRRYYQELEDYRYKRALKMRHYASKLKITPSEPATVLKKKMKFCTTKTRAILCQICEEYHWLKDLNPNHPKLLWLIQKLEDLCKDTELINWTEILNDYIASIKDKDVNGYPGTEEPEEPEPDDPVDPGEDPDDPPEDPTDNPPDEPGHCDCNCDCDICNNHG